MVKPITYVKCDSCGKQFPRSPCHIMRKNHQYCSKECYRKSITGQKRGVYTWREGRYYEPKGYVLVTFSHLNEEDQKLTETMKEGGKFAHVKEHRLVMARILGRPLKPTELVHHRNGKRDDNRPENLLLTTRQDHGFHNHIVMEKMT